MSSSSSSIATLTVVSLNLLSPKFLGGVETGAPRGAVDASTETRAPVTAAVLRHWLAQGHVVCLQEVCPATFTAFGLADLFAEHGYAFHHVVYGKEPYTLGVLVAYPTDRFTLVDQQHFVLVDQIEKAVQVEVTKKAKATPKGPPGPDGKPTPAVTTGSLLHAKSHVLQVVRLRQSDGRTIVVGNLHNPMLFAAGIVDRSVIQTAYTVLTTTAARLLHTAAGGAPCLLTGDWNCQSTVPTDGGGIVPHPAHVALTSRPVDSAPCPIAQAAVTALYASGFEPFVSVAVAVQDVEFPVTNATRKVDKDGAVTNGAYELTRIYAAGLVPVSAALYPPEVAAHLAAGFLGAPFTGPSGEPLTWVSDHVAFCATVAFPAASGAAAPPSGGAVGGAGGGGGGAASPPS